MSNTARAVRYSLVVVALTLTGFNGIVEGLNATHFADTPGMKVATATQLLYGFSAAAALVAMAVRRQLVFAILAVWSLALTATAVLAPVVYAGRGVGVGVAFGAATALVTGLLLWAWPPAARVNHSRT
jgi:hypothetical protein